MNVIFTVMLMIFCHIIADFNLQGWLASAKQKEYWEKNYPQKLYKHDYVLALIIHSFSWTFMVMLPIAYTYSFAIDATFVVMFLANVFTHASIDNAKANNKIINLWIDQIAHIFQIIMTAVCFFGG